MRKQSATILINGDGRIVEVRVLFRDGENEVWLSVDDNIRVMLVDNHQMYTPVEAIVRWTPVKHEGGRR